MRLRHQHLAANEINSRLLRLKPVLLVLPHLPSPAIFTSVVHPGPHVTDSTRSRCCERFAKQFFIRLKALSSSVSLGIFESRNSAIANG